MINGLGVLGWGVGGIEAEACMLGQPISMLLPPVVGFKLHGKLPEGCTATDLVLTITQMLRKKGVVGKFVEFYGAGLSALSLADRATVANMAPEYGATMGFFPVDRRRSTICASPIAAATWSRWWKPTPRNRASSAPTRRPIRSSPIRWNSIWPPSRRRWPVPSARRIASNCPTCRRTSTIAFPDAPRADAAHDRLRTDGSVVIAAITSCTNTSNPSRDAGRGPAGEEGRGARPASEAVGEDQPRARLESGDGLLPRSRPACRTWKQLNFHLVGFGCTTCIGNSGPLPERVAAAVQKDNLVVAAVLSGNRNFEGRINPQVKANYLASPPLVVAYALAGTIDIDIANDPLGNGSDGKPVYLRDIWPTNEEVQQTVRAAVDRGHVRARVRARLRRRRELAGHAVPTGSIYQWDETSTYIKKPPYFDHMVDPNAPVQDLHGLRVLAMLGDSVTTDHISPAGSIPKDSPAGKYLIRRACSRRTSTPTARAAAIMK